MMNCSIKPYNNPVINGKTMRAELKPDPMAGADTCEHLCGKAGKANFTMYTSKNSGFSLKTDKGYIAVDADGRVVSCNTEDHDGNKRQFSIYA